MVTWVAVLPRVDQLSKVMPNFGGRCIWISIDISLKFVPKGPINNIPALVQIMAWRRPGDKPLSEPMMVSLLTHICVTRPQWVNIQYITGIGRLAIVSPAMLQFCIPTFQNDKKHVNHDLLVSRFCENLRHYLRDEWCWSIALLAISSLAWPGKWGVMASTAELQYRKSQDRECRNNVTCCTQGIVSV